MHDPTQKRRWLRFSLRTLLAVVTLIGCLLGWAIKVRHDRAETRKWMKERGLFESPPELLESYFPKSYWKSMPLSMWLLGEQGLYWIAVPVEVELTREQRLRIEKDFPEARIIPAYRQEGEFYSAPPAASSTNTRIQE